MASRARLYRKPHARKTSRTCSARVGPPPTTPPGGRASLPPLAPPSRPIGPTQEVADRVALLAQPLLGRQHPGAHALADRQSFDDVHGAVAHGDGEGADQARLGG